MTDSVVAPLVLVDWDDPFSNDTWTGTARRVGKVRDNRCSTVGFLLAETKKGVVLAQNLGFCSPDGIYHTSCMLMTIQRGSIRKLRHIRGFSALVDKE